MGATSKHIKRGLTENQITGILNMFPLGGPKNGSTLENELQSSLKEGSCTDTIVIMVKDHLDSLLRSVLNQLWPGKVFPLVPCQWLLDSIGDFEIKKTSDYGVK